VLAVALSVAASCCWGIADFWAGLASRRLPLLTVTATVQMAGMVLSALLVLASGDPLPHGDAIIGAVLAGCSGLTGLTILYRALALGTMSVVAPIAATGVALPLVVGLLTGDHLATPQAVGLGATVVGVVLASREPDNSATVRTTRGAGLAALSAIGFGGYLIFAHTGARGGVPWLLLLSHGAALPVVAAMLLGVGGRVARPSRRDALALVALGAIDLFATGLYGLANRHGQLSIVAVVGSLYPVSTLVLARFVLRERAARSQVAGVALALVGAAAVGAG
jgi:drug/metabolite transporter (DMT)-like permease